MTDALPADLAEAHALILRQREELAAAAARAAGAEAMIAHLKLTIAKLKRERFGHSAERGRQLLDQLELQLEELESDAGEEARTAESQPESQVRSFARRRPVRAALPEHLPRERVVLPGPAACPCCGGKLVKLGEDVTETLEVVPRQWKVIQTVRERLACRACETISQPPAPFHPIARGRAGAGLLAMVLHAKYASHQPLNRQSEAFAREGIALDVSTLADWVGACAATLAPLTALIGRHVMAAARLHGDETTVPVLAKTKTATGRLWAYVRDDRPFGGLDPPAALFFYSRDRSGEHAARHLAGWAGILQADAFAGFGQLYDARRSPGAVTEAACWSHGRRKFFELADIARTAASRAQGNAANLSPLALEAVRRIDAIFAVERTLNGLPTDQRRQMRAAQVAPLVEALEAWMRSERARLSRHNPVAKAMDYMLTRWPAFARFLADGRICLTNNAAERELRVVALGRKNWTFCGSERGGERAAAIYTLIGTAKLNRIDPEAWLADVLRRINDYPASRLHELLPWNWNKPIPGQAAAA